MSMWWKHSRVHSASCAARLDSGRIVHVARGENKVAPGSGKDLGGQVPERAARRAAAQHVAGGQPGQDAPQGVRPHAQQLPSPRHGACRGARRASHGWRRRGRGLAARGASSRLSPVISPISPTRLEEMCHHGG